LFGFVVKIPKGKVVTYGELARVLETNPRAVGQALKANPFPVKIPCHRIIKSNGQLGGYFGKSGINRKRKLLESEGVRIEDNKIDLKKYSIFVSSI
jgi:methylated-DNA-[protein]-cysteine S-methyltransferase